MALDPLTAGLDLAKQVITQIWPDRSETEKAQMASALVLMQAQLEVNKTEAESPRLLVAGWRPFIGWVCGAACAWNWVGISVARFILEAIGRTTTLQPLDLSEMWPVLISLLGLGGLRTLEKVKGKA